MGNTESAFYDAVSDNKHKKVKSLIGKGVILDILEDAKDLEMIKILVKGGSKINYGKSIDKSPLYKFTKKGEIEIVKFLIESGAYITLYMSDYFDDDIIYCALENSKEIFKYFLTLPDVNINKIYGHDDTLLHRAIRDYDINKINFLIECGAEINIMLPTYGTPLCYAVIKNKIEICTILIKAGANVNLGSGNYPPILYAKNNDIIKLLLDAGSSPKNLIYQSEIKKCPKCNKRGEFITSKLEEQVYCSICVERVDELVNFISCQHTTCCVRCVKTQPSF